MAVERASTASQHHLGRSFQRDQLPSGACVASSHPPAARAKGNQALTRVSSSNKLDRNVYLVGHSQQGSIQRVTNESLARSTVWGQTRVVGERHQLEERL